MNYGRATWVKCMRLWKHVLIEEMKHLKNFDKSWGKHKVICDKRVDLLSGVMMTLKGFC
jgi:hypothetical protein